MCRRWREARRSPSLTLASSPTAPTGPGSSSRSSGTSEAPSASRTSALWLASPRAISSLPFRYSINMYHFSKYFLLLTEPEPGEILEGAARDLCHTKANRGAFKVHQVDELFWNDKKYWLVSLTRKIILLSTTIHRSSEYKKPALTVDCSNLRF